MSRTMRVALPGRRWHVPMLAVIASVVFAAPLASVAAAAKPEGPTWQRAQKLFHFHNSGQGLTEGACAKTIENVPRPPIRSCAGLIDSFDGLSLSVGLRLPEAAKNPVPTLLYLHAFNSNRGEFTDTASGWGGALIADSLAADGYAVVMPSARGMGGSCSRTPATGPHAGDPEDPGPGGPGPQPETPHGPGEPGPLAEPHEPHANSACSRGHTHVAERDFEIRDYQHLLGLLVDEDVAAPDRLGVMGNSYGGGQSWLLATSVPWLTPNGERRISLAAAVPLNGWTSNQNAFTPNGRATDDPDGGRSLERPFGVLKESGMLGLLAQSRFGVRVVVHPPRWNETDSSELHSFTTGWLAVYERGEPYDTPAGEALAAMFRNKSALYAHDYFAGLRNGAFDPVPILAVQGWTDALVPAVETLGMYRKLKAADPGYPISVFLGDVGHHGSGSSVVRDAWRKMAKEFLDSRLLHGIAKAEQVVSMSMECPTGLEFDTVVASDWDSTHPGLLTLKADGSLRTESGPPDFAEEAPTDPFTATSKRCFTQAAKDYEDVDYAWPVPSGGITLLGLPKLTARYQLIGEDATVVAKLWDVDGAGNRTLVTRGVYRLALAGGDKPSGRLQFQLFGNHYRFDKGHSIHLEISQTDAPFLRPNSLPSTIAYEDVKLEMPLPIDLELEIESARAG